MGSAGLSPKIKLDNPLERRLVSDIVVAGMSSVVRGRFDGENLAIQLISDTAGYVAHQQIKPISEDYHQSQKASDGAGHITQTTLEQQWESHLINDAEFTANTHLPSITFDVNKVDVSQQLGERVGEEVSHFYHPTPLPRNPSGFWQRTWHSVENVFEQRALIAQGRAAANSEVISESLGHATTNQQNYLDLGYTDSVTQTRAGLIGISIVPAAKSIQIGKQATKFLVENKWGFFGNNSAKNLALRQTGAGNFTRSADEAYNVIRANKTDITKIAKNTGIKPQNITKVKNHLFFNKHLLDKYIDFGIPAELKVFDSDIEIANSWARLESGNFTETDMQLLRHETAEAWYMRRNGPGYTAAHNAADARYPAPDLENMLENLNALNP